jgi:inner membrane protein
MDPLTHTLVGATLAETRLARGVRLGPAALIVGANIADVDVLSYYRGADFALGFRRGWTHGVLAMFLLPLVLTAALLAFDRFSRRRRSRAGISLPLVPDPRRLLFLSYLAVVSHPLLDWLNTYGVRLLMPFHGKWYYGDAVFIVDPWLWLMLGGSLLLARAGHGPGWIVAVALSSAIVLASGMAGWGASVVWLAGVSLLVVARRSAGDRLRGARTAVVGLGVAGIYVASMIAGTNLAAMWVRGELASRGIGDVGRLMIGPLPADPFRRDVLAEVPGGYRHGRLDLFPARLSLQGPLLETPDSAIVDATLRAAEIQGAVNWMRFPFAEIQERPDGYTVYLLDARYVRRRTDGFGSAVLFLERERLAAPGGESTP